MYLYIKQRVFSLGDKYDVYDENSNVVFNVQSEIFSFGAKLHLCNAAGMELYYIKQNFSLFLKKYEIYTGNSLYATVQQELSFFRPRLAISSIYGDHEIEGDFFHFDFEIKRLGMLVGSVHKKWLSWGDSYELYIPDGSDAAFFVALVIAVDNCVHNENR